MTAQDPRSTSKESDGVTARGWTTGSIELSPGRRIRSAPRPAITVLSVFMLFVLALVVYIAATTGSISWETVMTYLFDGRILRGVQLTIVLTIVVMTLSIAGGALLAIMSMSGNTVLWAIAAAYTWLFRGTPLLVQIIIWFNIALFVPRLQLGPIDVDVNQIISPYLAAILALGLHETAYMSEIIRGGLLGLRPGQREAATALGLTPWQSFRRVVLPQTLRIIVPPTGNQTIGMLKTTSLVSFIGVQDLLTQTQHIYATNFRIIELLLVASIWYLFLTSVASLGQRQLEKKLSATGVARKTAQEGEEQT